MKWSSPNAFFTLVFALAIPFWLAGAVVGPSPEWVPMRLPVGALMFVCPILAGALVARREGRPGGLWGVLRGGLDPRRIPGKTWLLVALLAMPLILMESYGAMRLLGRPLSEPKVPLLDAPLLLAAFSIGAMCEEAGWLPFAVEPLMARRSALQGGLVVGAIWAAWHFVPWVQMGRSPSWIAWYSLFTVAARVLLVWLYVNTGKSLIPAILFHAMINVGYVLFPNGGSHFDPAVTAVITALVAGVVVWGWGPATLVGRGRR